MAENRSHKFEFISDGPRETRNLGQAIGANCRGGEVILLFGQLGAGKTTFVQGLARGLGVRGTVQSPSFVLERIHKGTLVLRHLDLYRLSAEEVEDSGLLEGAGDAEVTVVEWADRASLDARCYRQRGHSSSRRAVEADLLVETESPEWESLLRGVKIDDR